MVLPVILSFAGSFLINSGSGILGLFGRRGSIEDDDFDSGRESLRSRADSIRGKNDPFATNQPPADNDDDFSAQSVKPRSAANKFTSQSAKPPASNRFNTQSSNQPPRTSTGSISSSPLPPPKANLSRRPTSDIGGKRNPIDDDFDSLNTPSLRDRRSNRRRRDSNDYDDEIMGGVFADEDGDDLI